LLDLVRFKGEVHEELEAFSRGDEFAFGRADWEVTREETALRSVPSP
jgi:hypothetical protein